MPKILQHTGGDVVEVILADHRWFEGRCVSCGTCGPTGPRYWRIWPPY